MLHNRETDSESTVDRLRDAIRAGRERLRREDRREDASGFGPTHQASASPQIQERALAQMESMLRRMKERVERPAPSEERSETRRQKFEDLKLALGEVCHRLEDTLADLGVEAQRLADETSRLALVADRPEARPEALRLRLRFTHRAGRGSGASLRPELWPRA